MEDNKKAITVSFLVAGGLVYVIVALMLQFLAQSFAVIARVESNEILSNGLPVGLGLLTFAVLQFNSKTVAYMDGVTTELRKVVWPSRKDTTVMTVVVIIMLIISGTVVGVYDAAWAYIVNLVVSGKLFGI
jgi:preprotein translocase subunit SecE